MLDPVQRRQVGIAALIVSAALMSVSAVAGVTSAYRRESVVEQVKASDQECENRLKTLGASTVSRTETQVVAQWNSLEGGYTLLGDSSAAAMSCPGWVMKSFCMGQECSAPGAKLELMKATDPET